MMSLKVSPKNDTYCSAEASTNLLRNFFWPSIEMSLPPLYDEPQGIKFGAPRPSIPLPLFHTISQPPSASAHTRRIFWASDYLLPNSMPPKKLNGKMASSPPPRIPHFFRFFGHLSSPFRERWHAFLFFVTVASKAPNCTTSWVPKCVFCDF